MTNIRHSLGPALITSLLAACAAWSALISWAGFVESPGTYLVPLLIVAVSVAASGALLRAIGTPPVVTFGIQVLLGVIVVLKETTGSNLPTGASLSRFADQVAGSVEVAQRYSAPIGDELPSVAPLLIACGAVVILLVDLLACSLRRVSMSGLALLAVFSIPVAAASSPRALLSFSLTALCFLGLLYLDVLATRAALGGARALDETSDPQRATGKSDVMRSGAAAIAVTTIGLALALPLVIPVSNLDMIGAGSGDGDDQITIRNPRTDLRRDLSRGEDIPLITVKTQDPDPSYLRVAVLNRFSGAEWSTGDRDVDADNRADGRMPAPQGVDENVPSQSYSYDVSINKDFDSTWLPTQFPLTRINAPGDWRYDVDTVDFLAADDENAGGLDYQMTALEYDFGNDGRYFRDVAGAGLPSEVLELSAKMPNSITKWANEVTEKGTTDFERATLLQNWFRTEFTYDLNQAPDGIGNETLKDFLAEGGRVGYCEQFASGMAVLARILKIPARVAVGFLNPSRNEDGTWTYSTHDLHAWPELYFGGAGWVRFEPTPSGPGLATEAPGYAMLPPSMQPDGPGDSSSNQPGASASAPAPRQPTNRPAPTAPEDEAAADSAQSPDSGSAGGTWLLLGAVAVVVLGAGAVVPGWLRRRQRDRRLAGRTDQVWHELWASAVDLDVPWPEGRSPRETGQLLVQHLAAPADSGAEFRPRTGPSVNPAATAAIDRIVGTVERARYARGGDTGTRPGEFATDAELVIEGLRAGASRRQARRARWLPRSLVRRDGPPLDREPQLVESSAT